MDVAITGASGLIGQALSAELMAAGHAITRLVRRAPTSESEIAWDPDAGHLEPSSLQGVDAVVHLAGEGIADRRWTKAQKQRILESRTRGTHLVADAMARLAQEGGPGGPGPRVLVSASGIHYYGERGDTTVDEDSGPGDGFLAGVVRAWEGAADPAREAGLRVVHPRIGIVQSKEGGALGKIMPLFRFGLGGRLGSGRQYWSWVSMDDVVGLIRHALETDSLEGPVNLTAPHPVTNAEYTATLGSVLRRPAVLPVPRFGPALLLGRELADELLFTSIRVVPERALASGYTFRHPKLEACLLEQVRRPA